MQSIRKKSFAAEQLQRQKKKSPATIAIIVLAVVIALGAVGYELYVGFGGKEVPTESVAPSEEKITIAVLPFDDLSDAQDQEFFGKGVAESIINKLTNIERLRVFSRTSSFEFKNIDTPIVEQCMEHGVDWLLEGSVRKSGNKVRITAQLIQVKAQTHVFSFEEDKDITDIFAMQTEIAVAVLRELKFTLMGKEQEAIAKQYTNDPDAYELFIQGRESESQIRAAKMYEQAIEQDPKFALAYAFLAQTYNRRGYQYWGENHILPHEAYPKAKELIHKALELDENLCEAYAELAWTSLYYDWDWSAAERFVRKALELNPGYAQAHHYYRDVCIVMGRWDEAIDEIYEARKYDPVQFQDTHYLGTTLIDARRYDEAIEEAKRRLALNTDTAMALWNLYQCYRQQGDYNEMAKISEEMKGTNGLGNSLLNEFWIGIDCALLGRKEEAMEKIHIIEDYYTHHTVGEMAIAQLYMTLGDFDKTFEWLEKAYEARVPWLTYISSFPEYDPIRSDPRYAELIKKMGLK